MMDLTSMALNPLNSSSLQQLALKGLMVSASASSKNCSVSAVTDWHHKSLAISHCLVRYVMHCLITTGQ